MAPRAALRRSTASSARRVSAATQAADRAREAAEEALAGAVQRAQNQSLKAEARRRAELRRREQEARPFFGALIFENKLFEVSAIQNFQKKVWTRRKVGEAALVARAAATAAELGSAWLLANSSHKPG